MMFLVGLIWYMANYILPPKKLFLAPNGPNVMELTRQLQNQQDEKIEKF